MVKILGLPADFNEAQLTGELEHCEEEMNRLVEELTFRAPPQKTLEGKMYETYAHTEAHKMGNEKADIPQSKITSYGIQWTACTWAASHCLTPTERKYGHKREMSVAEGIVRANMHTMEREFVKALCGPVTFCSDGAIKQVRSDVTIRHADEPLTVNKMREAYRLAQAGCPGPGDWVLMADYDTFEPLADADEFKNFDYTYGNGSSLLGTVQQFPSFRGLKYRQLMDRTTLVGDGTDAIIREPVFPVLDYTDPVTGNLSTTHVITFAALYKQSTVGYDDRRDLCVTMKDTLPNKLKDLLIVDAEWTAGLFRSRTKNVVMIPCVTPINDCKNYKPDDYPAEKFINAAAA